MFQFLDKLPYSPTPFMYTATAFCKCLLLITKFSLDLQFYMYTETGETLMN